MFVLTDDDVEHVAYVMGDVDGGDPPLVRVHSECLTGDVLGSRRCDCGDQLDASLRLVAAAGSGVVLYLRGHEGRGIGLLEKLRAYELQDAGLDTVDANVRLGHPVDGRDYAAAAAVLADLGVGSVRLLTNNPRKREAISSHGVHVVATEPLVVEPGAEHEVGRGLEAQDPPQELLAFTPSVGDGQQPCRTRSGDLEGHQLPVGPQRRGPMALQRGLDRGVFCTATGHPDDHPIGVCPRPQTTDSPIVQ